MSGAEFLRYNFKRQLFIIVAAFEDNLSDGVLGGVRDRKMREVCARAVKEVARQIVKEKRGRARCVGHYFDILPREAAAPTCAECFERRLFRGETRGIVLRRNNAAPLAIVALARCEDAHGKARRAAQDGAHPRHFDYVDAD